MSLKMNEGKIIDPKHLQLNIITWRSQMQYYNGKDVLRMNQVQ